MEYSIKEMSELSGVSSRTLRYYDSIHLLPPKRINAAGYRIYGDGEIDRLQQILLYKRMELKLEEIRDILMEKDFDLSKALAEHHQVLLQQQSELVEIIQTVERTLEEMKGKRTMTNQEKFKGLREQQIRENEAKYGKEIREKYGDEQIDQANKKYLNLSEAEIAEMEETERLLLTKLTLMIDSQEVDSDLGKEIFGLHKKWLQFSWPKYQGEAHKGLGLMYIGDPRFTAYYDEKVGVGGAMLLNDLIQLYA